jgi:hypothetical protein
MKIRETREGRREKNFREEISLGMQLLPFSNHVNFPIPNPRTNFFPENKRRRMQLAQTATEQSESE